MSAPRALLVTLLLSGCRHDPVRDAPLTSREQAQVYLQRNEPAKAIPLLEALHAQKPDDLDLARALAEAYVKDHRAQALIDRLTPPPHTAVAHYMRALAYFSRAADASGPALESFQAAIALAPNEAELHYRLGVALVECERYQPALAPLRRARKLAPERTAYALPLAKALHRTGDVKGAIEAVRVALSGTPSPAEVQLSVALMQNIADPFAAVPAAVRQRLEAGLEDLHERDLPQQAIVTFEEIALEYPDLAVVHALLGLAYQRLDDAGRAAYELRRAIELAPLDGKNHLYLAQLYLSRQQPKPAAEHFAAALAHDPTLGDAHFQLGDLALDKGDLEAAERHFRAATFLEPQGIPPKGKLALVYQLQGNWPAADHTLKAVLAQAPEAVEFKLRLGVLHTERYKKSALPAERRQAAEEAARWLEEVLAVQPENALASRALESVKAR
ncbi:MAG: tetratricopeptide repeat protein [Myxococcota bacterium]